MNKKLILTMLFLVSISSNSFAMLANWSKSISQRWGAQAATKAQATLSQVKQAAKAAQRKFSTQELGTRTQELRAHVDKINAELEEPLTMLKMLGEERQAGKISEDMFLQETGKIKEEIKKPMKEVFNLGKEVENTWHEHYKAGDVEAGPLFDLHKKMNKLEANIPGFKVFAEKEKEKIHNKESWQGMKFSAIIGSGIGLFNTYLFSKWLNSEKKK